ncbi:MAG: aminomethyl-transferring glycine dehydrogenase [Candidatus Marinimicrobia bacterium]|nr:aminomethyl-transferring glycine dehydrogenase [Candidatus Neomarinimicrobiota bacterium]
MKYIQNTDSDIQKMLDSIGVSSFEDLLKLIVPEKLRLKDKLNIGEPKSELDLIIDTDNIKRKNKALTCYDGGGVYDHYIPSVVDFISSRSEFYTSYTPYQAEVSQGTLQYLYEFQSMISALSGLEVSNASLYDGGSALAEACSMSVNISNKDKILLSSTINPSYIEVLKTYFSHRGVSIEFISHDSGISSKNKKFNFDDYACVVIQSPNYYGLIENWKDWSSEIDGRAILIAVSDPVSLSLLESPGECGADIYCGEGQSLGNYMNFGGPFLGLLSSRIKYVRRMPGRIVGKTDDLNGKDGYVLTLQAREQHIRRDRANSNICTNQSLMALRASVYMSLLGRKGLSEIAKICFNKSQYAAKAISSLSGFKIPYGYNFIKEFVVESKASSVKIVENALNEGISLSSLTGSNNKLLIAITEKRTKEDIDSLVCFLEKQ